MGRNAIYRLDFQSICLIVSLLPALCSAAEMATFGRGPSTVDACIVNVHKDDVRFFWRGLDGHPKGTFQAIQNQLLTTKERLFCASNAGIYDQELRPLGLYVENGKVLRKVNARKAAYGNFYLQPNGVFALTASGAEIIDTDKVIASWPQLQSSIRYATQSGPLLFQAGKINALFTKGSDSRTYRNGVCTRSPTEFVLVKSRAPINFYDFAVTLRDEVGCMDALYLDGSISQLFPLDSGDGSTQFGPMIGVTVPVR